MGGTLECFLPPGTYVLSWRLSFVKTLASGFLYPVKFSFETSNKEKALLKTVFSGLRGETKHQFAFRIGEDLCHVFITDDNWLELTVGTFTVGRDDSPIAVDVSLTQREGGVFKRGMFVDSVIIRPKSVRLS